MTQEIKKALRKTKLRVTSEEESVEMQKLLFSAGFNWEGGGTGILHINEPFLLISNYDTLTYLSKCDQDYFENRTSKEITTDYIRDLIKNNMETKEVKITVPQGYEIDTENSTFECIKFKKVKETKTWKDLISVSGYYIDTNSQIKSIEEAPADEYVYNVFSTKKQAKSALSMAPISQLMSYYGGEITDEEWKDDSTYKYVLYRDNDKLSTNEVHSYYHFVAFHTREQRSEFLKYNERLVKDYLMID